MKIPAPPPRYLLKDLIESGRFNAIFEKVPSPTVNGRYRHWDKLRYLDPPAGLSTKEWWAGLKFRRSGSASEVPLVDVAGRSFTYNRVDPLPEIQHEVDSGLRGQIGMPESITNRETRDQYVVRSLIEESLTSSQLEGAVATREEANRLIRGGKPPRNVSEQMVLNNYRTMRRIQELKGDMLTIDLVCELQRLVTEDTLTDADDSGRIRRPDRTIYVSDEVGNVLHQPPPASMLEARMAKMCDFANGIDQTKFVHPLIRAMVLHFWLAYDHPFVDGNGRTARALFYWSMLHQGYWLIEFISISKIILNAPTRYARAYLHTETDDNDLTYFLLYHADIVRRAVGELHAYIDRKVKRLQEAESELRGLRGLNARQKSLLARALRHPGETFTIEAHQNSHATAYQTARTDLLNLVERGLMEQYKEGRAFVFRPVDDLEARLR